jgi:hypothetical protein
MPAMASKAELRVVSQESRKTRRDTLREETESVRRIVGQ